VVTTRLEKTVHGATVSAFFTLSLEPLQVLVSLSTAGRLFVGAVRAVGANEGEPLAYFHGTYRRVALE